LLRYLPPTLRIVAPDLRGYGRSETAPVDATRGLRDFADDVAAVLDAPGLFPGGSAVTVVAHSMGCGVAMHLLIDHPARVAALMLEAPVSPYGFGGTRDPDGTPTTPDFAGTGAGSANPDFVRRLATGHRNDDGPTSPLSVLRSAYVADPSALGSDEQLLLDTVLSTATGDDNYPGDSKPSPNWPGVGPGDRGVLNTMAPNHFNVAADLVAVRGKPPITWVRGDRDAIVSDTSFFDLAYLGSLGVVPGWPGGDGVSAAADGRSDPGGARAVCGGGRGLHRDRVRELRALAAHRAPGRLRRRAAEAAEAALMRQPRLRR
jgi:pimeloyl-ACP methyl ester carboxylesterase